MSARTSTCQDAFKWLKANGLSLAPLTGTDVKAIEAAVHILHLYAVSGDAALLAAFAAVVRCMQPGTQEYAYHVIAFLHEWDSRPRIWARAGLPPLTPTRRCTGEW